MAPIRFLVIALLTVFLFEAAVLAQPACRGSHAGRVRPKPDELKIHVCAREEVEATQLALRFIGYGVDQYVRATVARCRELAATCGNQRCPNAEDVCKLNVNSRQERLTGFVCTNTGESCRQTGPEPPRDTTCWECTALRPVFSFTCACECGAPHTVAPPCNQ